MIYLIKSPEARKLDNGEYEFFFSLKIGYTDDEEVDFVKNRRLNIYFTHHRTIELLHTIPNGTEEQEKKLHYKFRDLRWNGSNEWYVFDQSIIDYIKTVTLEDIDKLPINPDVRSNKFFNIRRELRKILQYVYNSNERVDEVILDLASILGDNFNINQSIEYLKSQGVDFSKYYEVKNTLDSGRFCDDNEVNQKISQFFKEYQTLTRKTDRLKMLCELEMPKEAMDLILNQLSDSDQVKSYYINLGPERIKQLGYNVTRMNKELGIVVFSLELLQTKIYSEFNEGEKRTLSEIKDKLNKIYLEINYKRNPKATDLSDWFEIKPIKLYQVVEGSRKQFKGYELIKKLK